PPPPPPPAPDLFVAAPAPPPPPPPPRPEVRAKVQKSQPGLFWPLTAALVTFGGIAALIILKS
ncbi:hypothetical protein, partial [Sandarakinorhabdus rubra]|uniref:hypothetical protein n=1 Tax=Sandarakinorhabdus rubra TaxID=2672568 RepID=UPI001969EE25